MFPHKLKHPIKFKWRAIKFYTLLYWDQIFNKTVREQIRDYKSIPIFIISFNQLFYLKKLIEFLTDKGYKNIIIIDNKSTYIPLLEYFETIKDQVDIMVMDNNYGHRVFWLKKDLFRKFLNGYYVVTDADVVPEQFCPEDFLLYFKRILDTHPRIFKVGFSLRIDNIPDFNLNKEKIIHWENKFWQAKIGNGNYLSDIDTTFALYRPNHFSFLNLPFMKGVRTKEPYTADHGGWHVNSRNPTKEQRFYMENANDSSSWRIDGDGKLSSNFSKRYTR